MSECCGSPCRLEGNVQCFRHRSGSLESQSHLLRQNGSEKPAFTLSPARRSNSSEALDDCSSYTSLSSADYAQYRTIDHRVYDYRQHRKVEVYGNTGSMPNLVHNNSGSGYAYPPPMQYGPMAYYVAGCPCPDYEPYSNGGYVYESELEGHYNLNPSYQGHGSYPAHGRYGRHYSVDGPDSLAQNPYATMRPPRGRQGPRNELLAKNMQKALVVEHLRGWYHRSAIHREVGRGLGGAYDYERGSQHSLGYQTLPAAPFSHSSRTTSFSSGKQCT